MIARGSHGAKGGSRGLWTSRKSTIVWMPLRGGSGILVRTMRSHRTVGLFMAVAMAVSACGWPDAGPAAQPPTADPEPVRPTEEPLESTIDWQPCGDRFECATLEVPLDYAQPDVATVPLALIRLPAPPAARRIGSLVVNPGGPGGSGVEFVRQAAIDTIPAELRARFDIVGFDPRGVGASGGIDCGREPVDRFAATPTQGVAEVMSAAQGLAVACAAQAGDLLGHMSTAHVVEDLERLRAALGDRRLTYVGYSYGTLIGAMYADRYPKRVRALVLDGAVDPSQDVAARSRDKAAATEQALANFLQWCRADDRCPLHQAGPDPAAVFDTVQATLAAGSVPALRDAAPITARGSPPLVVIGTVNDGVTPYRWSQALAAQLDHAVLFTRDGDSHTAFGGGNVCTDRAIMGYLLDEEPPEAGLSCG